MIDILLKKKIFFKKIKNYDKLINKYKNKNILLVHSISNLMNLIFIHIFMKIIIFKV